MLFPYNPNIYIEYLDPTVIFAYYFNYFFKARTTPRSTKIIVDLFQTDGRPSSWLQSLEHYKSKADSCPHHHCQINNLKRTKQLREEKTCHF